jgi:hypothetical protein
MSVYPNLPPDDAVDGRVLDTIRTVLRAPEVTPAPAGGWDRVVHEAVTGGHAAGDHDVVAQEASTHDDSGREGPGHEHAGHEAGWPAGHEAGPGGLGAPGDLQELHDSHDSHDGGGHW